MHACRSPTQRPVSYRPPRPDLTAITMFTSLPIGQYKVSVEKVGFKTEQRVGISVAIATTARIDVKLEVGQVQKKWK